MRLMNLQFPALALFVAGVYVQAEDKPLYNFDESSMSRISVRDTFELINKSSDMYGSGEPNPAATVRTVNCLHSLGKERAIAVLRAYQKYADALGNQLDLDMPNQERLCVIIPLLFFPSDGNDAVPSLERSPWKPSQQPELIHTKQWELRNIIVISDLPFNKQLITVRGSLLPDRAYLVEWAEKHGRLREKRLSPSDDPLAVADEICDALKRANGSFTKYERFRIRTQAWRSIQHLIPLRGESDELQLHDEHQVNNEDGWNELQQMARELTIRWSDEQQQYVAQ